MARILVTRAPHQASTLADALRALGAEPILIPTIDIVDPTSFASVDNALVNFDTFRWLVFTSANAVLAFNRRFNERPSGLGEWAWAGPFKFAAIGLATAAALNAIGVKQILIPPQAVAESLAEALLPYALESGGSPGHFLIIRAEEARDHLPETLRAAGADVTIAPVYRTVIPEGSIDAIRELFFRPENYPDAITFTSSSTARNLFALLEAAGITLPSSAHTHPKSVILSEAQRAQPKDLPPSPHPKDFSKLSTADWIQSLAGASIGPASLPSSGNTHPKSVILSEAQRAQPKGLPPSQHPQDPRDLSTTESTRSLVIASIGPITSATLRDLGHPPDVEATQANVASLAENLVKYLHLKSRV